MPQTAFTRRRVISNPSPAIPPPPSEDVPSLLRALIRAARKQPLPPATPNGQLVLLSLEVDGIQCTLIVRMVAKGYGNKTIARVLDISCWTVGI
jgi:hypothetical protein